MARSSVIRTQSLRVGPLRTDENRAKQQPDGASPDPLPESRMTTPIVTSSETWVVDDIEAVSAPGVRLDPSEHTGAWKDGTEREATGCSWTWCITQANWPTSSRAPFRVDYGDLLLG